MGHYDDCYEKDELRRDREAMRTNEHFSEVVKTFKKENKTLIKNNPKIDFAVALWGIYKEAHSQGYLEGKNDLVEKIRNL